MMKNFNYLMLLFQGKMHAQDRKQIEKANARNAVEEYVYDVKEKLETIYKEFITEQVIQLLLYCTLCVFNTTSMIF